VVSLGARLLLGGCTRLLLGGCTVLLLGGCAVLSLGGCAGLNRRPMPLHPYANAMFGLRAEKPPLPELTETSDVGAYISYALRNNPGVEAAFQNYVAALERIPQVTALPDPRLSYRYYIQEVETRVGPQEHAIGLSQTLPWFGKLALQGEIASSKAEAVRERFEAKKDTLVAEVIDAYLEYYHLGRAIAVVQGNRDLVQHLERVARTRYGAGAANHPDVIRAQVELGVLENQLASLKDRAGPFVARLNASLNRRQTIAIPFPTSAKVVPLGASDADVLSWIASSNPDLRALRHEMASARAAGDRAEKDFYPDLTLGVDYIATGDARMGGVSGSGDDAVIAGISLNIPFARGKYRAAVREAKARGRSAALQRSDLMNRFQAEAATALFRLRDAERQIDLYQDTLLPKARESLNTTQSAYSSGNATFTDLVDAQRVLLSFELSYERSLTDHGQWRAALERLVGRNLPAKMKPETPQKEQADDPDDDDSDK
jgi:cobalt-zinc-cadmium efflux system outer membrane protein